jgi:predicted amino acid racemase
MIEDEFDTRLPVISGGNSSSLSLLFQGDVPSRVNNLRIGEAILLGTDTATGGKFTELYDDAFVLEAALAEVKEKPSFPIGTRAVDAFGKTREYVDRGIMRRGILAIGRQDVPIEDLIPMDSRVQIVGGSSDHLIVDLSQVDAKVGDVLQFKLTYGGLLGAYTSKYVSKCIAE